MRRALVIFLLAVLPFQFVWGAAAGYCRHEPGSEVSHFGHHLHKHQSTAGKASDAAGDSAKQLAGEDADCISCHFSCASFPSHVAVSLLSDEVGHVVPTVRQASFWLLVPSIDRPNWASPS